jgi:hypothetical protein
MSRLGIFEDKQIQSDFCLLRITRHCVHRSKGLRGRGTWCRPYDPQAGEFHGDHGGEIAAYFLDTDYDDRCLNVCYAYFLDSSDNSWEKLARMLRGTIDKAAFESLKSMKSMHFDPGCGLSGIRTWQEARHQGY